jgi:hypothetical protein
MACSSLCDFRLKLFFYVEGHMAPDEVEQMLYQHAIRTKIRAPLPERLSNLGYSRVVASGIVAGAALVCSLVMSKSSTTPASNAAYGSLGHPQVDTDPSQRTNYHVQSAPYPQSSDQASAASLSL